MSEHRIVAVALSPSYGPCERCTPTTPHQVTARCACGEIACGTSEHIWSVASRVGGRVWLTPSFNWLVDPRDPSKGSHLHEHVEGVPVSKMSDWPLRESAGS